MTEIFEVKGHAVECAAYFKSTKGFRRVMLKMKDKVKALGAVGGTIVLNNPIIAEKEALSGLMRKDYSKNKSITLSLTAFQESLKKTRFGDVDLSEVLSVYFDDPLESNRSLAQAYTDKRDAFFNVIIENYRDTEAGEWLSGSYKCKKGVYSILIQKYDNESHNGVTQSSPLKNELEFVCKGLNSLPYIFGEKLRLPVFATAITTNPHFFDSGTFAGRMLISGICHIFNEQKPASSEKRAMLLYQAGILNDDVSNHVLCYGLVCGHSGWAGFSGLGEPLVATLANLNRLTDIKARHGKVYVFENPAVFSSVLDKLSIEVSLICTYGQVKIAALVLMDMLAQSGCKIFYSGDFDPEGLMIADKLKRRYKENLILWRYRAEDYLDAKSENPIDAARLKKLDSLEDKELITLAMSIKEHGMAGYQERLIEALYQDIASGGS